MTNTTQAKTYTFLLPTGPVDITSKREAAYAIIHGETAEELRAKAVGEERVVEWYEEKARKADAAGGTLWSILATAGRQDLAVKTKKTWEARGLVDVRIVPAVGA